MANVQQISFIWSVERYDGKKELNSTEKGAQDDGWFSTLVIESFDYVHVGAYSCDIASGSRRLVLAIEGKWE